MSFLPQLEIILRKQIEEPREGTMAEDHDLGVANGLASEDMDNVTHCSVVLHVDLDCFYAAVRGSLPFHSVTQGLNSLYFSL